MAPVVSEEKEMDENCPKMLCQLDDHQACVNSVRWSYSGKYLASGGDDKLIMIWNIAKYPSDFIKCRIIMTEGVQHL
ncbi:protein HIRA-like isoform X2 [Lycorma delicatula]|uniref:protein HIRA-like isoform X2 n=1 Tax=Lycorma delicatula TaxID=130591 RepID=UPI003F50F6C5